MIKLLAIDMDGTCLDQRSRMTDRTLDVLRKAAKAGITVVPCTGRNLGCIPHRLAAGVLRESKTEDDEKNKDLFRYVITSNGAMVTDVKEKKTLFRALIKKEDALSILSDCRKEKFGIAAHVRHRYFAQGKLFTSAGRIVYGKDAAAVCCVRRTSVLFSYVKRKGKIKRDPFGVSSGESCVYRDLCRNIFKRCVQGEWPESAFCSSWHRERGDCLHRRRGK